jgi:hypothetical protein
MGKKPLMASEAYGGCLIFGVKVLVWGANSSTVGYWPWWTDLVVCFGSIKRTELGLGRGIWDDKQR